MPLSNREVDLILTWPSTCVITNSTDDGKFAITDIKLYVPVVTLSTQSNTKLRQQLKSGFKRTVNCNKYQSDPMSWFMVKTFLMNQGIMILKHIKFIRKVATGQGDDYTTDCLLDYFYFKENYKWLQ